MSVVHENEIVGTDKPVIEEKESGMFTFNELVYTYQNTNDFEHVAFLDEGTDLYEKLYSKK